MVKAPRASDSEASFSTPVSEEEIALDAYCGRLSESDRRVELIGGFEAYCRGAGLLKAAPAVFDGTFLLFTNRPA